MHYRWAFIVILPLWSRWNCDVFQSSRSESKQTLFCKVHWENFAANENVMKKLLCTELAWCFASNTCRVVTLLCSPYASEGKSEMQIKNDEANIIFDTREHICIMFRFPSQAKTNSKLFTLCQHCCERMQIPTTTTIVPCVICRALGRDEEQELWILCTFQ